MKSIIICIAAACLYLTACGAGEDKDAARIESSLSYCHSQVRRSLAGLAEVGGGVPDYTLMPRNIASGNSLWHCRKATKEDWCAGFWPGVLWYAYEYSGDTVIRKEAERFTVSLEFLSRTPAYDHDLGFSVFCSYGNAYRLTGNPYYRQVILDVADTLPRSIVRRSVPCSLGPVTSGTMAATMPSWTI